MAERPPTNYKVRTPVTGPNTIALEKLKEMLTCSLCLDLFKKPKLLRCLHTNCEDCLRKLPVVRGKKNGQEVDCIQCPVCRETTFLPAGGVSDLFVAFYIDQNFDVYNILKVSCSPDRIVCRKCNKRYASDFCAQCQFICDRCKEVHSEWNDYKSHVLMRLDQLTEDRVANLLSSKKPSQCSKHPDQLLVIYCEKCEELICYMCTIRCHRDHQCDALTDAFPKIKKEILDSLQPLAKSCTVSLRAIKVRQDEIRKQQQSIEADIFASFKQLHSELECREKDLRSQLNLVGQRKLKRLSDQQQEMEKKEDLVRSYVEKVNTTLQAGREGEVLNLKKHVLQQMKETSTRFKLEEDDIKFTHKLPELTQACKQIGAVYDGSVCPAKCYLSGPGRYIATVGEETTVIINFVDAVGDVCHKEETASVECDLVNNGVFVDRRKGLVEVMKCINFSYVPEFSGQYQLNVTVNGVMISKCPSIITVLLSPDTRPVEVSYSANIWRVITSSKNAAVATGLVKRLEIEQGLEKDDSSESGLEDNSSKIPVRMTTNPDGNILECDIDNDCIQVISPEGDRIRTVGSKGNEPGKFHSPKGIAVHPRSNKIYIVDSYNYRIQILNPDFSFCSTFGIRGSENVQIGSPSDIAIDSTGRVFVLDNGRVHVFTESGEYIQNLKQRGDIGKAISTPVAIAVHLNLIFVLQEPYACDRRISIFTTEGEFLEDFEREKMNYRFPRDLKILYDGTIFVCLRDRSDKHHIVMF